MATTHEATVRNGIASYVTGLLNAGTVEITTSGDVEVATHTFAATAFGTPSAGIATANTITDDTSATGGVAAKIKWKDSGGTTRVQGTITGVGGGGDCEMSSTTIGAGNTVTISNATYTAPL